MGVVRSERILGLHPRSCHRCRPAAARLVTRRRWAYAVAGVPLVALDARWRSCTGCARRSAMPRLSLATTVTATLVLAFLLGADLVAYGATFVWALLVAFWGTWLIGHVLDMRLDARLAPVPARAFRPHAPARVHPNARRRATRSLAHHRPERRFGRLRRGARALGTGTRRLLHRAHILA